MNDRDKRSDLFYRYLKLKNARAEKMRELMKQWDEEFYNVEVAKIREECSNLGHVRGRGYLGTFGFWYDCQTCGTSMNDIDDDEENISLR